MKLMIKERIVTTMTNDLLCLCTNLNYKTFILNIHLYISDNWLLLIYYKNGRKII